MRAIIIKTTLVIILISAFNISKAQYHTGIGIRMGTSKSISMTQYFDPISRFHFSLGTRNMQGGIVFTTLYEIHSKNHNINIELANVGFFFGIGGHIGRIPGPKYGLSKLKYVTPIGLDCDAGVEWKFPKFPLLLTLDIRPYYEYVKGKAQPDFLDYALSLKYVFR
ncbi:MAG: hypothetical protein HGB12_03910 [Bacteroidetes bacterium]|nr:hypothetical protein [Bacteroidota bacterium]